MAWLTQNWFWLLTFVAFIVMHLFGHGGHSRHGRHGGGDHERKANDKKAGAAQSRAGAAGSGRHQH